MTNNVITVVGDRFAGFAVVGEVCTASQFIEQMVQGATFLPTVVCAGQGVSEEQWDQLTGYAHRRGYDKVLSFRHPSPVLTTESECHKRREDNSLVADLTDRGDGQFSAALRVHNNNELLLDHQTGMHVQGMVSIEAARQMFLAATERFLASANPQVPYYYVINAMNTTFENFLFPVDAEIQMKLLRADLSDPNRLRVEADIEIHQAGRRSTLTYVSYDAFNAQTLAPVELKRAEQAARFHPSTPATPVADAALESAA